MDMQGAGEVTGPQLMAEIGDVRRFTHKGALVASAGMDAPPFQSGTFDAKSRRISKRGSPYLRRTLFQIASTLIPLTRYFSSWAKSAPRASTSMSTLWRVQPNFFASTVPE